MRTSADKPRILVVEDEWMSGKLMAELLKAAGYIVVGPAPSVEKALKIAAEETIDAALLDLNLRNMTVYPVAETLMRRNIPFAFLTGYDQQHVKEAYRIYTALQKPVSQEKLLKAVKGMLTAYVEGRPARTSENIAEN